MPDEVLVQPMNPDTEKFNNLLGRLKNFNQNLNIVSAERAGKEEISQLLLELFATEAAVKLAVQLLCFIGKLMADELLWKDIGGALLIAPPFYREKDVDRATFGSAIDMYERLRPANGKLVAELRIVKDTRDFFVHELFASTDAEREELLSNIPKEMRPKAIKQILHDVMSDTVEIMKTLGLTADAGT